MPEVAPADFSRGAANSEVPPADFARAVETSIVSDVFGVLATPSLRTTASDVATPADSAPVAMAVDFRPVDFARAASCAVASSADFAQAAGTSREDLDSSEVKSAGTSAFAWSGAPSQSVFTLELCCGSAGLTGSLATAGFSGIAVDHSANRHRPSVQVLNLDLSKPAAWDILSRMLFCTCTVRHRVAPLRRPGNGLCLWLCAEGVRLSRGHSDPLCIL